jgi:hypothetical protein
MKFAINISHATSTQPENRRTFPKTNAFTVIALNGKKYNKQIKKVKALIYKCVCMIPKCVLHTNNYGISLVYKCVCMIHKCVLHTNNYGISLVYKCVRMIHKFVLHSNNYGISLVYKCVCMIHGILRNDVIINTSPPLVTVSSFIFSILSEINHTKNQILQKYFL